MNIVRYNKEKEFNLIPKKELMDLVTVEERTEASIMRSWEAYLSKAGVPFAIEKDWKRLILWKERRA